MKLYALILIIIFSTQVHAAANSCRNLLSADNLPSQRQVLLYEQLRLNIRFPQDISFLMSLGMFAKIIKMEAPVEALLEHPTELEIDLFISKMNRAHRAHNVDYSAKGDHSFEAGNVVSRERVSSVASNFSYDSFLQMRSLLTRDITDLVSLVFTNRIYIIYSGSPSTASEFAEIVLTALEHKTVADFAKNYRLSVKESPETLNEPSWLPFFSDFSQILFDGFRRSEHYSQVTLPETKDMLSDLYNYMMVPRIDDYIKIE